MVIFSGRKTASSSIPARNQEAWIRLTLGTAAMKKLPIAGTTTPASAASQANEPSVMNDSSARFDWGIRPKSRIVAQAIVIVAAVDDHAAEGGQQTAEDHHVVGNASRDRSILVRRSRPRRWRLAEPRSHDASPARIRATPMALASSSQSHVRDAPATGVSAIGTGHRRRPTSRCNASVTAGSPDGLDGSCEGRHHPLERRGTVRTRGDRHPLAQPGGPS